MTSVFIQSVTQELKEVKLKLEVEQEKVVGLENNLKWLQVRGQTCSLKCSVQRRG